jgi:hypothetical protein
MPLLRKSVPDLAGFLAEDRAGRSLLGRGHSKKKKVRAEEANQRAFRMDSPNRMALEARMPPFNGNSPKSLASEVLEVFSGLRELKPS